MRNDSTFAWHIVLHPHFPVPVGLCRSQTVIFTLFSLLLFEIAPPTIRTCRKLWVLRGSFGSSLAVRLSHFDLVWVVPFVVCALMQECPVCIEGVVATDCECLVTWSTTDAYDDGSKRGSRSSKTLQVDIECNGRVARTTEVLPTVSLKRLIPHQLYSLRVRVSPLEDGGEGEQHDRKHRWSEPYEFTTMHQLPQPQIDRSTLHWELLPEARDTQVQIVNDEEVKRIYRVPAPTSSVSLESNRPPYTLRIRQVIFGGASVDLCLRTGWSPIVFSSLGTTASAIASNHGHSPVGSFASGSSSQISMQAVQCTESIVRLQWFDEHGTQAARLGIAYDVFRDRNLVYRSFAGETEYFDCNRDPDSQHTYFVQRVAIPGIPATPVAAHRRSASTGRDGAGTRSQSKDRPGNRNITISAAGVHSRDTQNKESLHPAGPAPPLKQERQTRTSVNSNRSGAMSEPPGGDVAHGGIVRSVPVVVILASHPRALQCDSKRVKKVEGLAARISALFPVTTSHPTIASESSRGSTGASSFRKAEEMGKKEVSARGEVRRLFADLWQEAPPISYLEGALQSSMLGGRHSDVEGKASLYNVPINELIVYAADRLLRERDQYLNAEFVFRMSGSFKVIQTVKTVEELEQVTAVHDLVGIVRRVLRDLPHALLAPNAEVRNRLKSAVGSNSVTKVFAALKGLPPNAKATGSVLFHVLSETAKRQPANKMGAKELSIVFAPSLMSLAYIDNRPEEFALAEAQHEDPMAAMLAMAAAGRAVNGGNTAGTGQGPASDARVVEYIIERYEDLFGSTRWDLSISSHSYQLAIPGHDELIA